MLILLLLPIGYSKGVGLVVELVLVLLALVVGSDNGHIVLVLPKFSFKSILIDSRSTIFLSTIKIVISFYTIVAVDHKGTSKRRKGLVSGVNEKEHRMVEVMK